MASGSPGVSRPHGWGIVALIIVAVLAGAAGFAGGWFGHGFSFHTDGTQGGIFSLDAGEERKVAFPRPYVAAPRLQLDESNKFFTVIEVRPDYFKVKGQPGASVQNHPWKAQGVLAE